MTLKTHHALTPLTVGTEVSIQNQRGSHCKRWDNSGVVGESLGNSQHKVKVGGSGRITPKNRVILRRIPPFINNF